MGGLYCLLDDRKKIKGVRTFYQKDESFFKSENEKGFGVFFAVNEFDVSDEQLEEYRKTSGKPDATRRNNDLCTKLRYVYGDLDVAKVSEGLTRKEKQEKKEMLLKALLEKCEPTLVIDTSNGLQPLWQITDTEPTPENKEKYVRVNQGVVEWSKQYGCKADNVFDCARILRLFGYYHQKQEPYLCDFIHKSKKIYSLDELTKLFPIVEEVKKPFVKDKEIKNDFWGVISNLNNKMVLERLSGQPIINGEIITFAKRKPSGEKILVNGKEANAWLDEQGMIGGGSMTWIGWIKYFEQTSKGDIARWAKQNLAEFIPEELKSIDGKAIETETSNELIDEIRSDFNQPKSEYTWGLDFLDTRFPIIEKNESYIVLFGQQGSGKTLFALWHAKELAKKIENVYFLSLEMTKKQILKRYCRQKQGLTKEQYRNREYETEELLVHLKEVEKVNFIGIDKGEVYDLDKIDKIITTKKPSILFIDNFNKIESQGKTELETDKLISKGLLGLNRKHKIPIVVIHHANKVPSEKGKTNPYNLRGLSGMRGSNKILDDIDIGIEIARPKVDFTQIGAPNPEKNVCYLAVYKDRDNDEKTLVKVRFHKGEYLDEDLYNTTLLFNEIPL